MYKQLLHHDEAKDTLCSVWHRRAANLAERQRKTTFTDFDERTISRLNSSNPFNPLLKNPSPIRSIRVIRG